MLTFLIVILAGLLYWFIGTVITDIALETKALKTDKPGIFILLWLPILFIIFVIWIYFSLTNVIDIFKKRKEE